MDKCITGEVGLKAFFMYQSDRYGKNQYFITKYSTILKSNELGDQGGPAYTQGMQPVTRDRLRISFD